MQHRYALLGLIPFLGMAAVAQDTVYTSVSSGVYSGSAHFGAPPPEVQAVAGAPYSAEETLTMIQTLADGTHLTRLSSTRKLYRDAAGRTRTERSLPGASRKQKADVPVIVEITDPVEHVRYTFDSVNQVAHKQALAAPERDHAVKRTAPRAAPGQPAGDDAPQFSHQKLESQNMEGLLVEGTRFTTVYPAGSEGNDRPITVVRENWFSAELQVTVLSTDNDPRNGESTRKLVNIDRGEPDPSLFLPPATYTVVEEKGDFTIQWGSEK